MPTVVYANTLSATAGQVFVTGLVPAVMSGAYPVTVSPVAGLACVSGLTPVPLIGNALYPGLGLVATLGGIAVVQNGSGAAPEAGVALVQGFAPALSFNVAPQAGIAVTTGFAPGGGLVWSFSTKRSAFMPTAIRSASIR